MPETDQIQEGPCLCGACGLGKSYGAQRRNEEDFAVGSARGKHTEAHVCVCVCVCVCYGNRDREWGPTFTRFIFLGKGDSSEETHK